MSAPGGDKPAPADAQPTVAFREARRAESIEMLPLYDVDSLEPHEHRRARSSDGERTINDEACSDGTNDTEREKRLPRSNSHLTAYSECETGNGNYGSQPRPSRERQHRLDDDLEMLRVERQVSRRAEHNALDRSRSRGSGYDPRTQMLDETVDEFDIATNPVHDQAQVYRPVEHPTTRFGKFVKRLHGSNWLVRYVTYITPPTLILLIPLLLGALLYQDTTVGGVYLLWFMIWLEIVWLTLWAGRILAKCLPWPIGLVSSLFTDNSKKWRDMGKQLELPATLFFWGLAIEVSFLPTMTYHQKNYKHGHVPEWMDTMNKVLVSLFVGAVLNFVAKIIIQLIAISFHLRTYADRIEINKFQIGSLTKLYKFSKEQIAMDDSEFFAPDTEPGSGARTPGRMVNEAAKMTKEGFNKFGDVAGKIAGDFTGRQTRRSTHPYQVVLALLGSTAGAQILARRLYRTFAREESETVMSEDLRNAFDNDDEADAAFTMFDKDLNGDISMQELEAVCVEIGRERKSITASLKDLDSVVGKLDDMFMFVVFVVTILVFLSLISTSAAGVLTSAGSAVLALSWLLSATAQEFLQSCIFVFVKHPFDVGDRVTIYGNTGASLSGDDYFVKEISLLYTEFKKMEGHVVQAPNSYLNTLFILNQRRSGGLAEAMSITIKFGTTLEQIEGLRSKLLEFVKTEKREFQSNILTELRDIVEVNSMTLNVIFFYKSNWQNEGLRLARRNKFVCALMVSMQEMGIEGPMARLPGQRQSFPVYLQNVPHVKIPGMGHSGHPNAPEGMVADADDRPHDPPFVATQPMAGSHLTSSRTRSVSSMRNARPRHESLSQMNRRVDFSLGAQDAAISDMAGDVYEGRERMRVPLEVTEASRERQKQQDELRRSLEQAHRESIDAARSTSRDDRFAPHVIHRRSTDSGSRWHGGSVHRNRFLARYRTGPGDETILENGMADIPEDPSPTSAHLRRLDPRTGMISPQAMSSSHVHVESSTPRVNGEENVNASVRTQTLPRSPQPILRSRTEDFARRP